MHLWRLVLQEGFDGFVEGKLGDAMIVFQHQHESHLPDGDVIDQTADPRLRRRQLPSFEQLHHSLSDPLVHLPQRSTEIGEKAKGIVIAGVESEPRRRVLWPACLQVL